MRFVKPLDDRESGASFVFVSTAAQTDTKTAAAIFAIPELATPAPRDVAVGDLVVMIDFKGREIGARAVRIHCDGSVTARVCGLTAQPPYQIGDPITREAKYVRRAI